VSFVCFVPVLLNGPVVWSIYRARNWCALTGGRRRKRGISEPRWRGWRDRCIWTTEHSQPSVYQR